MTTFLIDRSVYSMHSTSIVPRGMLPGDPSDSTRYVTFSLSGFSVSDGLFSGVPYYFFDLSRFRLDFMFVTLELSIYMPVTSGDSLDLGLVSVVLF